MPLTLFNRISAVSGNARIEVLREYKNGCPDKTFFEDGLKSYLIRALDPNITFGVGKKTLTQVEKAVEPGDLDYGVGLDPFITDGLHELAERRLTGGAAEAWLMEVRARYHPDTFELVRRILLKDLRCGITAKSVNKVWPDLISIFEVMLAHKYDANRIKQWPVNVEIKLDGVRVATVVNMRTGVVQMLSRTGKEFNTFDHIHGQLLLACRMVFGEEADHELFFDGEMVTGSFNKTVGEVRKKGVQADDAIYHIFDMMPLSHFYGDSSHQQGKRRRQLEGFFRKLDAFRSSLPALSMIPSHLAHSDEEIQQLFNAFFEQGFEGVIVKELDKPYVRKRNHAFMKIKGEESEDLKIVRVEEGEGKYVGMMGKIIVDFNGVEVGVGTGFTDEDRRWFWEHRHEVPGRIMETEYHEVTPDGSLRHARYKCLRDLLEKGVKV